MSLRNLLKREVISCSPDAPVSEAAQLMEKKNVGCVVVSENGIPSGIVTDRDLVLRCLAKGIYCTQTPVSQIMTKNVETINLDEGIYNVVEKMREREIRRVPVIDESGKAVGLLFFGDVFQLVGKKVNSLLGPTSPEEPKIQEQAA